MFLQLLLLAFVVVVAIVAGVVVVAVFAVKGAKQNYLTRPERRPGEFSQLSQRDPN